MSCRLTTIACIFFVLFSFATYLPSRPFSDPLSNTFQKSHLIIEISHKGEWTPVFVPVLYANYVWTKHYINSRNSSFSLSVEEGEIFRWDTSGDEVSNVIMYDSLGNAFNLIFESDYILNPSFTVIIPPLSEYICYLSLESQNGFTTNVYVHSYIFQMESTSKIKVTVKLINEEAFLFAKYLRDERETWIPRIAVPD